MIQKKICMLGAYSVGKTSLVRRYVESIFDERYLITLGVKIDKIRVALEDREGKTVRLQDFRGKKVLLLTWASW